MATTVLLGQFTWEHANAIAGKLEKAGITWWHKQSGPIAQFLFRGDWGVRVFVDADRLDEAKALAAEVLQGMHEGDSHTRESREE